MPTLVNLRPIQTGDACYLTDHHNRDGEAIITVVMHDGITTLDHAQEALFDAAETAGISVNFDPADLARVVLWCGNQWVLAQVDMPRAADRDNEAEGDESERYLECHILATWEA
jgi:hypothetical protein